jgi:hypothetical protein
MNAAAQIASRVSDPFQVALTALDDRWPPAFCRASLGQKTTLLYIDVSPA